MKIGVLALQGDVREHRRALEAVGATPVDVRHPSDLSEVAGLVIPGGESTTIGKLLDRFALLDPIRSRTAEGLPLFGTCAGLILMARDVIGDDPAPHGLGVLDVTVRRNAYGRQLDSFEADVDLEGRREPLRAVFIRAPAIERSGEGVEVLARYRGCPVLVQQGNLMGASFHPEMTSDPRVHSSFVALVEEAGSVEAS